MLKIRCRRTRNPVRNPGFNQQQHQRGYHQEAPQGLAPLLVPFLPFDRKCLSASPYHDVRVPRSHGRGQFLGIHGFQLRLRYVHVYCHREGTFRIHTRWPNWVKPLLLKLQETRSGRRGQGHTSTTRCQRDQIHVGR